MHSPCLFGHLQLLRRIMTQMQRINKQQPNANPAQNAQVHAPQHASSDEVIILLFPTSMIIHPLKSYTVCLIDQAQASLVTSFSPSTPNL